MTDWGTAERPAVVCIGTPVYDTPEHDYVRAERALIKPLPDGRSGLFGAVHYLETRGVTIELARNQIVAKALEMTPAVTHVLFVDSDMVFPSKSLQRLLAHDLPVVGGLYFNRRPPHAPIVMRSNDPSWHDTEGLLGHVYNYPSNALFEVEATGCGFLLIQRAVLESCNGDWFDRYTGLSEDFSFCVRVIEKGWKVHVDTGLRLGHIGKVVVDEAFAQRNRLGDAPRPWRRHEKAKL